VNIFDGRQKHNQSRSGGLAVPLAGFILAGSVLRLLLLSCLAWICASLMVSCLCFSYCNTAVRGKKRSHSTTVAASLKANKKVSSMVNKVRSCWKVNVCMVHIDCSVACELLIFLAGENLECVSCGFVSNIAIVFL
jgi:hypothetical protein